MALKKGKLHINCFSGINDVLFGMSPDDVIVKLGKADETTTVICDKNEIPKQTEIRKKAKFFYEDDKLVCITGDLGSPFYLEDSKIPSTFLEALNFLKSKSKINFRFLSNASYIFFDLGIVIHPYEIVDIEAGFPTTTKKFHLSVCNMDILNRFTQYFVKLQIRTKDGQSDPILSKLDEIAQNINECQGYFFTFY